ncbi:hypothetical protein D3C77_753380 [compost metagenome]
MRQGRQLLTTGAFWPFFFSQKATPRVAIQAGINMTEMRIGGVRYITTRIRPMNARHR